MIAVASYAMVERVFGEKHFALASFQEAQRTVSVK